MLVLVGLFVLKFTLETFGLLCGGLAISKFLLLKGTVQSVLFVMDLKDG